MTAGEDIPVPVSPLEGNEDLPLPRYMTERSSGMDLRAAVEGPVSIPPGEWRKIPAGFVMALPPGLEAQIRPRSGLALEHGVSLLNSPGTVDADYRGEVAVILVNHGKKPFVVHRGFRVAQMVIQRVCRIAWDRGTGPDETPRGAGGFGHTGTG